MVLIITMIFIALGDMDIITHMIGIMICSTTLITIIDITHTIIAHITMIMDIITTLRIHTIHLIETITILTPITTGLIISEVELMEKELLTTHIVEDMTRETVEPLL